MRLCKVRKAPYISGYRSFQFIIGKKYSVRPWRLPIEAGISPFNALLPRLSFVRLVRFPNCGGISPCSPFTDRSNSVTRSPTPVPIPFHSRTGANVSQLELLPQLSPLSIHRAPPAPPCRTGCRLIFSAQVNWFRHRDTCSRLVNPANSVGSSPPNWLSWSHSSVSSERLLISAGTWPLNLFEWRDSSVRPDIPPSSAGRVPLSWFECRCSFVRQVRVTISGGNSPSNSLEWSTDPSGWSGRRSVVAVPRSAGSR